MAIIGVGVTLLGVLVLLLNMRPEIAELRWDLHALDDRIARIGVDSIEHSGCLRAGGGAVKPERGYGLAMQSTRSVPYSVKGAGVVCPEWGTRS